MKDLDLRDLDDEALVREAARDAASARSRAAASELFGRYQRRVYLWCHRYVRDHEKALEMTQEVFMRAWSKLATFESRARFSSWLFVIARNRCLNAVAAPSPLRDEAALEQLPAHEPDPAEAWEQQVDEERLRALLRDHLDADEREALWLRCFEKLPVDEITRVMGLDNSTGARALLQRARRRLRAALGAREEEDA